MQNTDKPFSITTRIYVEDTDYGGIVYYANYLKYMERARTELIISLGYTLTEFAEKGFHFVVHKAQITYSQPAKLNDLLEITATVSHIGNSSMTFSQLARNQNNQDLIYAEAEFNLVCVNNKGRPIRIPDFLREKITTGET